MIVMMWLVAWFIFWASWGFVFAWGLAFAFVLGVAFVLAFAFFLDLTFVPHFALVLGFLGFPFVLECACALCGAVLRALLLFWASLFLIASSVPAEWVAVLLLLHYLLHFSVPVFLSLFVHLFLF